MTGLDKMINQILEEANNSANEKIEAAKAQAQEIIKKAEAEAKALGEEISNKSDADIANYKDRVKSSADLKRRTEILTAKQEMISQTIDKAYETFCSMDDTEYFETLKKMLDKFVQPQEGEIHFSSKDLSKLPSGFEADVEKIAATNGGKLTVSKEERNIERGFILAYGGIEENCSFKALFDSQRDELQDKVQKILFS